MACAERWVDGCGGCDVWASSPAGAKPRSYPATQAELQIAYGRSLERLDIALGLTDRVQAAYQISAPAMRARLDGIAAHHAASRRIMSAAGVNTARISLRSASSALTR